MADNGNNTRRDLQLTDTKLDHLIDKIGELAVDLAKVGTKQCAIHEDVLETKANVRAINGRVGRLENWRSYLAGGVAVIVIVIGVLVKYKL